MMPSDRVYKKRVCSFLASTFKQSRESKEVFKIKTDGKPEKSRRKRVQSEKVGKGKKKAEKTPKENPKKEEEIQ